ncbi:MAG: hypothetical protein KIC66_14185 [Clostridium sp.]|nr:hypothetical protein [Clostridium sp.]
MLRLKVNNSVKASTIASEIKTPVISDTYKSGFYSFDNKTNVDIGITLLDDTPTKVMILDNDMNIEFLTREPYQYRFYLRNIEPGKTIGIVGEGKVAITFEQSK